MIVRRTIIGVLILSTPLFLTHASPTQGEEEVDSEFSISLGEDSVTEPPTTELTATTTAPNPSTLLYEVKKGIHNLSLDDIEYVLDSGPEVFPYVLADRLGYLKDKDNDIHIPVIEKHQKMLTLKLEAKRDKLKSAVNPTTRTTMTDEAPASSMSDDKEKVMTTIASDSKLSRLPNHDKEPTVTKSPKLLLYEVERGIDDLSLDKIEYVLELDPDVFTYSLADRLGYLIEDKDSDVHLPVIEKNKKALISKLEAKRDELRSARNPTQPPTTFPPPPPLKITVNRMKIKYDIAKGIPKLSLDAINDLLEAYDDSTLPYAVGEELGYDEDRDVEHFQYLDELGGEKLREILTNHREKKLRKVPVPNSIPKSQEEQTGLPTNTDDEGNIFVGPNGGGEDVTPDRRDKPDFNGYESDGPKSSELESKPTLPDWDARILPLPDAVNDEVKGKVFKIAL